MVTGSFTLVGIEDLYAYIITCSSGSTIPTKADGTCKAAVTVNFKKKTDEGLVVFAAPKVIISVLNSSGAELSTETYNNRNAADVTEIINTAGVSAYTLNVSLYDGSLLLATDNFHISRDTDVYTIESNVGSVVQCDENGKVVTSVVLTSCKNGTETNSSTWIVTMSDSNGNIGFPFTKNNVSQIDITEHINNAVITYKKAPETILVSATMAGSLIQYKMSVSYRNAMPVAGTMPWASGNSYKNGNYIEYEDMIYMWSYPVEGNSTLSPKEDVSTNPETTKWKAYQLWDLWATKVLLAKLALVGQAVFFDEYMISQQGTDADLNPSSDYQEFPNGNFIPNFMVNFLTGRLDAKSAYIEGNVTAKSGKIGGLTIQDGWLYSNEQGSGIKFTGGGMENYFENKSTSKNIVLDGGIRGANLQEYSLNVKHNRKSVINKSSVEGKDIYIANVNDIGFKPFFSQDSSIRYGYQYAGLGSGHYISDGIVEGTSWGRVRFSANSELQYLQVADVGNKIIVATSYDNNVILLPSYQQIQGLVGYNVVGRRDGVFNFEILFINQGDKTFYIAGRNNSSGTGTGEEPMSSKVYPLLYGTDGNRLSELRSMAVPAKQTRRILLDYDAAEYYAFIY